MKNFSHVPRTLRLLWALSPQLTTTTVGCACFSALLPLLIAWLAKLILESILAASAASGEARQILVTHVIHLVLIECAVIVVSNAVERIANFSRHRLGALLTKTLNYRILEASITLDLEHTEQPEFQDQLTRARQGASTRPLSMLEQNLTILRSLISLAVYTLVLSSYSYWLLAGLLISVVPAFWVELRFTAIAFADRNRRTQDQRRVGYLAGVLTSAASATEVRAFGFGPRLLAMHQSIVKKLDLAERTLARERHRWTFWTSSLGAVGFYSCYLHVAASAAQALISIGELTFYLAASRQSQTAFQRGLSSINSVYNENLYMVQLFDFLDHAAAQVNSHRPAAPVNKNNKIHGLHLMDVGFRYRGSDRWVLRDVNLDIPPGLFVGVAGANGAGKSTLVKLISGLYVPTAGQIMLHGRNVLDGTAHENARGTAVMFQGFGRYQMTVAENIGLGAGNRETAIDVQAVARAAGAFDMIKALPKGFATQLGRLFEYSSELSGGQWQRLAFTRTMARDAELVILDEPTSSLDLASAHSLLDALEENRASRIVIIISHRPEILARTDRVLFLQSGRPAGVATHQTLMEDNEDYSRLFGSAQESRVNQTSN